MNATCYGSSVSEEVSIRRAAEILGISEETIRTMVREGELTSRKTGEGTSPWAIPVEELERVQLRNRGAVTLTDADLAEAAQVQADFLAAEEAEKAARRRRDEVAARLADKAIGYGAVVRLADAMGVHRTTLSRYIKEGRRLASEQ
jgi:excisionase family DNA binding protein